MGKQNSERLYFGGFKITADGDCSHRIKRHLLLGRKAMRIIDSVLKSRDIILLTKLHIVKVMVFPVVFYWCESWTMKKAEGWRTDAFKLQCWRRLLKVPWTASRSNQSILKEINSEYSLEGWMLKLKLQYFVHLMQRVPWWWERWRAGGEGGGRRWDGWIIDHYRLYGHESEQTMGDSEGQGNLVICSPWGHKESDTT